MNMKLSFVSILKEYKKLNAIVFFFKKKRSVMMDFYLFVGREDEFVVWKKLCADVKLLS